VLYSIYSLSYISTNNFNFVIYTDQSKILQQIIDKYNFSFISKIQIQSIDASLTKKWSSRGTPYKDNIEVLRLFYNSYSDDALFIDNDMYFTNSPESLFRLLGNNEFFMHEKINRLFQRICNFREDINKNITISNNHISFNNKFFIEPQYYEFSSGIIGLSYRYRYLLDQINTISDTVYDYTNYNDAGNTAFSITLQENGKVHTSEQYAKHFGFDFNRYFLAASMGLFLNEDRKRLEEYLAFYNLNKSFVEKIYLNLKYNELPHFICIFEELVVKKQRLTRPYIYSYFLNKGKCNNTKQEKKLLEHIYDKFFKNEDICFD